MPVIDVKVARRQPYAHGQPFGDYGPYERIDGTLTYAVNPAHPVNAAIVDLRRAPVDAAGRVQFEGDFTLVAPPEPDSGHGRLLVEAVNRGRRRAIPFFNRAPAPPLDSDAIPTGDGFLLRHGYSVLFVGWQWDVYRSNALIGLDAPALRPGPIADDRAAADDRAGTDDRRPAAEPPPVTGQCCVEMRPHLAETTRLLANRTHRPYPAADLDDPHAMLLVRDWEDGPDTLIPRAQWRFARATPAGIVPSAEHIYLESGFQPGKIYYAIYTAAHPVVVGCGMLAVRDAAAWLRHPDPLNPLPGGCRHIYGYGISQSGRLLRTMLYLGLNLDEAHRPVFDGLLPHVAGGRLGEFNHRFAQPSCQSNPGFGHRFPFADDTLTDPLSGQTDGLLRRLRQLNAVPKIIYTNSSAEYWRGDASLTHLNAAGSADLEPPEDTRHYLFASAQHLPGAPDQMRGVGPDGSSGRHPYNVLDYIPLLRAALVNLHRWAADGIAPPASQLPRLAEGAAVSPADYLEALPAIPNLATPDPARLWRLRELDLGPDADRGIAAYPVREGREYPHVVPASDADGSDRAGIRLPDLTVPVATHTGWNLRHPDTGAPEQLMSMQGSTHWFAPTAAPRVAAGDPRLSLAERYADRADYAAQVTAAAAALVDAGFLLAEDLDLVVRSCLERYDCALASA